MSEHRARGSSPGSGALFAAIAVFVIVGVPLVYIVWDAVNHALTGNLNAVRPGLVLAAVGGLTVVLYMFTRVLRRWSDGA